MTEIKDSIKKYVFFNVYKIIQPSPSTAWLFWVAKQNYIISDRH